MSHWLAALGLWLAALAGVGLAMAQTPAPSATAPTAPNSAAPTAPNPAAPTAPSAGTAASDAPAAGSGAHDASGRAAPVNPHSVNPHAVNPHAANPHGDNPLAGLPQDRAEADPSLPKGSIAVRLADPSGAPLPNTKLKLIQSFQSIALGDQQDTKTATTNGQGEVVFSGLTADSNHSYRVSVERAGAEFASPHFRLTREQGHRVLLHVYPVTHDPKAARIAMRGLIYVQPRDDVFQCEIWFQIYNLSRVAWVPRDITVDLPAESKAFTARESMRDTRFEADGDHGAKLLGTFTPGQHDARFAIQVPNHQKAQADFYMSLPPHLGEFRVVTEAVPGMTMNVSDYPPVQNSTGFQGERVLVSQKRGSDLKSVHFTLAGLPTRGKAPWVAVLIAALAAASGLYSARNAAAAPRNQKRRKLQGDLKQARDLIVGELVALERAKAEGQVGPQSYERTRRALTAALARILQPAR